MTENTPEFFYWPQYILTYNVILPSPAMSTGNVIVSLPGIQGSINQIYATVDVGSVNFTIKIAGTPVTGLTNLTVENTGSFTASSVTYTANGLVSLATGANTFISTNPLTFDILGTTGAPTVFTMTVFYTQIFT